MTCKENKNMDNNNSRRVYCLKEHNKLLYGYMSESRTRVMVIAEHEFGKKWEDILIEYPTMTITPVDIIEVTTPR